MSEINWNAFKCYNQRVSAAEFNRLVDQLPSLVIEPGLGYGVSRTVCGTNLRLFSAPAASAAPCPLQVTVTPISGDADNQTVSVRPGTVNGYLATNMFDSFTVSTSELSYVKASISSDGQTVTSWSLSVDSDEPDVQSPTASSLPTSFDYTIATISGTRAYRTIDCGSLVLTPTEAFITDAGSVGPGELTYVPYYCWEITTA